MGDDTFFINRHGKLETWGTMRKQDNMTHVSLDLEEEVDVNDAVRRVPSKIHEHLS